MVIVGVRRQTGVFEYVAIWAAKHARGRPFLIMVMLVVLTAVASVLLNKVPAVLLVAPVTLLVCERRQPAAVADARIRGEADGGLGGGAEANRAQVIDRPWRGWLVRAQPAVASRPANSACVLV
ncbi:MAG: SLC13 family permease [Nocardioidaceae bacterium]